MFATWRGLKSFDSKMQRPRTWPTGAQKGPTSPLQTTACGVDFFVRRTERTGCFAGQDLVQRMIGTFGLGHQIKKCFSGAFGTGPSAENVGWNWLLRHSGENLVNDWDAVLRPDIGQRLPKPALPRPSQRVNRILGRSEKRKKGGYVVRRRAKVGGLCWKTNRQGAAICFGDPPLDQVGVAQCKEGFLS